jgi:exodeoxyribonuclease III
VRLATWNVNGIRARKDEVAAFLDQEQPDVLCMQELKATPAQIPEALTDPPGYWCYWHGMKGYSGVSLHVRREFSPDAPRFWHPEFDHETRIVVADLLLASGRVSVASMYVPNGGRDFLAKMGFLHALEQYVIGARALGLPLIVCGDVNIARTPADVHPRLQDPRVIGQRADERAFFERLLAAGGLTDLGRALDPDNESLFTWWAPWRNMRQRNIGWRLDYVLATRELAARASTSRVSREVGTSDHAPVIVTLELSGGPHPPP